MAEGQLILIVGALLLAGVLASLAAAGLRVPGLVLFLGVGMLTGSDGTGWIRFDNYEVARAIGIVALALILFEGGLGAGVAELRPVIFSALSLAVVGTLVTAVIVGVAATWLFDFSTLGGLLVGSIVAATDGAAIFALLRRSTLKRRLARTLEGEAGFNDPVAVLLVLGFIQWIQRPSYGVGDMAVLFAQQLGIGLAVGVAVGWLAVRAFGRLRLDIHGLYPVASLGIAGVAFGAADSLHGSGFLAVYLAGVALGTGDIPAKATVTAFHDGLAWVAQVTMFVTLGLLVFPSQLDGVALEGTVLALVLVFIARPVAVVLATLPARYSAADQAILSAGGLHGAVPVVLATFPVIEQVAGSLEFFNIVFFAVLLSTLVQGTMFEPLTRRLGATTTEPALPGPLAEVVEYAVDTNEAIVGAPIRDLGLPHGSVITVLVRDGQAIAPRGSTEVRAGDHLHVFIPQANRVHALDAIGRWRSGPPRPGTGAGHAHGAKRLFTLREWIKARVNADGAPPND